MKKTFISIVIFFCACALSYAQIEYGANEEATVEVVSLSISAENPSYKLGEPVEINVALQNIDRTKRRRLFLSGAALIFEIKDKQMSRKSRSYSFPEQNTTLRVNASVTGNVNI